MENTCTKDCLFFYVEYENVCLLQVAESIGFAGSAQYMKIVVLEFSGRHNEKAHRVTSIIGVWRGRNSQVCKSYMQHDQTVSPKMVGKERKSQFLIPLLNYAVFFLASNSISIIFPMAFLKITLLGLYLVGTIKKYFGKKEKFL